MKAATTMQDFITLTHKGSCLSDALHLWWLWAGPMDLHAVEDMLRCLAATVAPGAPVRFAAYDDARYRAALRMHLDDIPVPGAVGGVSDIWPGMSAGTTTASVLLHVEAWAMAQSGRVIELADLAPMMEELRRVSAAYRQETHGQG